MIENMTVYYLGRLGYLLISSYFFLFSLLSINSHKFTFINFYIIIRIILYFNNNNVCCKCYHNFNDGIPQFSYPSSISAVFFSLKEREPDIKSVLWDHSL